jgi:hypothetical protein
MVELKYEPVSHNHKAFLKNAQKREGFSKAYNIEEDFPNRKSWPGAENPKRMDGNCHHAKIGTEYASFVVFGLDDTDTRFMGF